MSTKKVIFITIIVILGMLIVPTIYKVYKDHNHKLIVVVEKEFLYQAQKCHQEDICGDLVYLKDLYEHNYFESKLTNPLNKKYYDPNSSINLNTMEINLIS